MDNLVAIPHTEGLQILKDELFERIQKFSLIDDTDTVYYTNTIHSTYFDTDGVLTVVVIVPKAEHFTNWNKAVRVLSDDDLIIADVATPAIQFVMGVGGEQIIKLTVSGEAGVINFKADEYITPTEAQDLFLLPLIANTNMNLVLQNKLIEKGVIDG
jgi:hypothetical protein